jgi:hypothetical protein
MKKTNKVIIAISIVIILILFIVMYFQKKPSKKKCASFYLETSSHNPSELIRQVTLKFECDVDPKFKVDKYIYDDKNDMIGAISGSKLIYHGTADMHQVLMDTEINKEFFHGYKVHNGALNIYKHIKPQLKNIYIDTVYGYSLGAMLSALTIFDIYKTQNIDVHGYLIGNPPIGEKKFKNDFNKYLPNVYYTTHPHDFIAQPLLIPTNTWIYRNLFNYYSVGKKVKKFPYKKKEGQRAYVAHFRYF